MRRFCSWSRVLRIGAMVGVLGGTLATTTLTAAAAFTCSTPGSFQTCEITDVQPVVVGGDIDVTFSCTVVSTAVVIETGTSCYVAVNGTTSPVSAINNLNIEVFAPGQAVTVTNSVLVPLGSSYWICMVPAYVNLNLATVEGQHDCSSSLF